VFNTSSDLKGTRLETPNPAVPLAQPAERKGVWEVKVRGLGTSGPLVNGFQRSEGYQVSSESGDEFTGHATFDFSNQNWTVVLDFLALLMRHWDWVQAPFRQPDDQTDLTCAEQPAQDPLQARFDKIP